MASEKSLNGLTEVNKTAGDMEDHECQIGSSCTVMKLWEMRTPDDRITWLTEPPPSKPKSTHSSESAKYVITLLYGDAGDVREHSLNTIIMRGPALYDLLKNHIPNISAYYSEAEHGIAMRSPFRSLFWSLDRIRAATDSSDRKLAAAAALLREVLEEEFKDLMAKRRELLANQEMNFNTLWTLFNPGITCLTPYEGKIIAVKVSSLEYKTNSMGPPLYKVLYTTLEWDGKYFGWREAAADILKYSGRRKINELVIFPIEWSQIPAISSELANRGRRFVEIAAQEPYMMSFSGETLDHENSGLWWQAQQKKKMSQRVVLDARAYDHYNRRIGIGQGMTREKMQAILNEGEHDSDLFIFCCPEFHCYALERKEWARVWIDNLEEVVFNDMAYSSLVLPRDYKKLLLAFAEAQIDSSGFDDVIAGKGQGILMLLAGPPGTGKTLTAEAMAEHMRRPLYSVSAGEIGAATGSMEFKLDRVLQLATRWNSVLLLDEADVFLEKRTDNDLERNTVVSVFLKKLEYYRGIMFLTTNRIGSFDEAFKSRIHIAIRYPDLDASSRKIIWGNFLKSTKETYNHGIEIDDDELNELSQKSLNGREIRNIIKSAQLLASRSKEPLKRHHLEVVWRVEHEESPWEES